MSTAFPREIVDLIVDFISQEEHARPSMSACALAAPPFLSSVRAHRFSTLVLNQYAGHGREHLLRRKKDKAALRSLVQLLENDRDLHKAAYSMLAPQVKVLVLKLSPTQSDPRSYYVENTLQQKKWNYLQSELPTLLAFFPQIREFGLKFHPFSMWSSISRGIQDTMLKTCRAMSLNTLHIHNAREVPPEVISDCLNLKFLFLKHVAFKTPKSISAEDPVSGDTLPLLEALDITCAEEDTPFLRIHAKTLLSKLSSLSVRIRRDDRVGPPPPSRGTPPIIFENLRILTIETNPGCWQPNIPPEPWNLSHFRMLEVLELYLDYGCESPFHAHYHEAPQPVTLFCVLHMPSTPTTLTDITIKIKDIEIGGPDYDDDDFSTQIYKGSFESLDALITKGQNYQYLERFTIHVVVTQIRSFHWNRSPSAATSPSFETRIRTYFINLFPLLTNSGTIRFEVKVTVED